MILKYADHDENVQIDDTVTFISKKNWLPGQLETVLQETLLK